MAGKLQKTAMVQADALLVLHGDLIVRGGMMVRIATSKSIFQVVRSSAEDPALLTRLLHEDDDMLETMTALRRRQLSHTFPTTLADGAYKVEISYTRRMTLGVYTADPTGFYKKDRVTIIENSGPSVTVKTNLPAAQHAEVRRLLQPIRFVP